MKTSGKSTKTKRVLRLFAVYGLTDLLKGGNPLKTGIRMTAAAGKAGMADLKKKSGKALEGRPLLKTAVTKKTPKEQKRSRRKKAVLHYILHKLA